MEKMKYDQKKADGCIAEEVNTKNSEEEPCGEETNVFPIPYTKFTNPTIQDQLRTLYQTLEQFYLTSHRIKNP